MGGDRTATVITVTVFDSLDSGTSLPGSMVTVIFTVCPIQELPEAGSPPMAQVNGDDGGP